MISFSPDAIADLSRRDKSGRCSPRSGSDLHGYPNEDFPFRYPDPWLKRLVAWLVVIEQRLHIEN